jgi:taurine dioxygenase
MSRTDTATAPGVATDREIEFERVTTNVGAIVHGVDVRVPQDLAVASLLRRALPEHGVLFFFSDEEISDEEFRAFAPAFGEPFVYPYGQGGGSGNFVTEDGSDADRLRTSHWHTDGSPQERPPQAALLSPVQLPTVGGDTLWASMTAAFDALSPRLQGMLEGMDALHSTEQVARHYKGEDGKSVFGAGEAHVHPVVITDPVTRRKALYVNSNYTERLIGMSERESTQLLDLLFDHINTPEFHVRLRWRPNMIAVWEERVTQHRAVADYRERRVLRRITITGDRPPA